MNNVDSILYHKADFDINVMVHNRGTRQNVNAISVMNLGGYE